MKLYRSAGACSLAVHVALEQVGAAYEDVDVPLARGAQHEAAYRAVNPLARVPALEVEGVDGRAGGVLTEVLAILLYLDQRFPQARLMPEDALERARLTSLMGYVGSTLHIAFAALWRPERFTDDATAAAALKAFAPGAIERAFDHVESRLPQDGLLGGDRLSAADAYLLPFWRWAWRLQMPLERWPRHGALVRRLAAQPAVQRALAAEGLAMPS